MFRRYVRISGPQRKVAAVLHAARSVGRRRYFIAPLVGVRHVNPLALALAL
ncbi:hypothetical protein LA76x_3246 [Lysobacter antibioticus]|uniref:Uncharacterized protein n=1 Tax=Lysobacter antibioticus TaxID=84531 RepID=A0A0S2FD53_LYSAN|nr:hypothetical protein LA76x_3246 [Lysobacter antibioticus]